MPKNYLPNQQIPITITVNQEDAVIYGFQMTAIEAPGKKADGNFQAVQFGATGDKVVAADYDSDGKTDIAVFRSGVRYVQKSSDNSFYIDSFGTNGDILAQNGYFAE